jgi:fibronectin type 3 domain-containing protein
MNSGIAKQMAQGCLFSAVFACACALWLTGCGGLGSSSTGPTLDTTPPTAPANLTATSTLATQINLGWTASTDNVGVAEYKVERCQGAGCANFSQIATPTATAFNDTGLTASTAYSYRVRATDAAGNNSTYSNIFTTTTLAAQDTTPPTTPTNLTATAASSAQINLSWTASTDNVGVTGYKVERCTGAACANFAQIATPTAITFNDTGLAASTSYSYRVRAYDAAGNNSGYSNTATAATSASAPGNISVALSPRRGGITISQTAAFTATVTNDQGGMGVAWSATGGTLTGQTATTATFSSTTAGSFTITATSNADNTRSASATIGVTDLSGVFTYHNNLARDGTNTREFALTTSNVVAASFGKLFSCAVDGHVYAQPLWAANVAIGGGKHNVIVAATENDSVYAFDADANPCVQYWKTSFLGTGITPVPPGDTGTAYDINTPIGITGTPVIDPSSQTLYVVAKTKEGSNYHQRLHALSLIDGTEKFNGPLDLTPAITVTGTGDTGDSSVGCTSNPGSVPFCPLHENQRPGLALANGLVYVAWASHGDTQPYHGWIMSFTASNLQQAPTVFNDSPNGRESGIWMSGGAPAFDSSNNMYVITGNGDYNSAIGDYGDSFLKLNSGLTLQDWFTPAAEGTLDSSDLDLGSGGAVVLIDLPSSVVPHVLIGGGKGTNFLGQIYVVNRDNMGQFNANTDNVVQEFSLGGGIFATAAFWQSTLYIGGVGQNLRAFALSTTTSMLNTSASSQSSHAFGFPGTTPSISSAANATGTGVVWALDTNSTTAANASGTNGPTVLYAYDATNLATQLFQSDTSTGSANAAGNAVKFCVPTVANGKVYVGTQTEISVFGLLP